jgi:hypothetical protein
LLTAAEKKAGQGDNGGGILPLLCFLLPHSERGEKRKRNKKKKSDSSIFFIL